MFISTKIKKAETSYRRHTLVALEKTKQELQEIRGLRDHTARTNEWKQQRTIRM
jgi:hypothetical protein